MNYILHNQFFTMEFSTAGGEMQSIQDSTGREWLWQGDKTYWNQKSPVLFPFIGKNTGGHYSYENHLYPALQHGFLYDSEMSVFSHTESEIIFELSSSETTKAIYPFDFLLRIRYALSGTTLAVTFTVENLGASPMFFGLGGHPGFQMPLDAGCDFEDYSIVFQNAGQTKRILLSDDCFPTGERAPYPLQNGTALPLRHNLFEREAIILQNSGDIAILSANKNGHSITVQYPDMPFFAVWHTAHTKAPFICLEPWTSLPARQHITEDLATQPDLISVPPRQTYTNAWSITLR
ncbi:MAG: aldose 1-epimerase family protein [Ruthenibacterium sp.]